MTRALLGAVCMVVGGVLGACIGYARGYEARRSEPLDEFMRDDIKKLADHLANLDRPATRRVADFGELTRPW